MAVPVSGDIRITPADDVTQPGLIVDSCSDLHSRKEMREKSWALDGWAQTVSKVCLDPQENTRVTLLICRLA